MFKYIYGPINSNRMGLSIGIDILGSKICSMNCIYCEIKKTDTFTIERKNYVPISDIILELNLFLSKNTELKKSTKYITISGKGEPTLHLSIKKLVLYIKNTYPLYKVCIITNSSLLHKKDVRNSIIDADLIMPSLDSVLTKSFKKINIPHRELSLENIKYGIKKLSEEFKGKIWLEILFSKSVNDSEDDINKLIEYIKSINVDSIYINTVIRPPAFMSSKPISNKRVQELQKLFNKYANKNKYPNKEVSGMSINQINNNSRSKKINYNILKERILEITSTRPSTIDDILIIIQSYNYPKNISLKVVQELLQNNQLVKKYNDQITYYINKLTL